MLPGKEKKTFIHLIDIVYTETCFELNTGNATQTVLILACAILLNTLIM